MTDAQAQLQRMLQTETSPFAMATLVSATGRTPRRAGARMFVGERGRILGTITIGGCVDARVVEASERVLAGGGSAFLPLSLDDDQAWEIGLTCGGSVEVLVERVDPGDESDAVACAHRAAFTWCAQGTEAIVAAPLAGASRRIAVSGAGRVGSLGDAMLDDVVARDGWSAVREGGGAAVVEAGEPGARVFVERVAPSDTVIVYGAGEVARSLVPILRELDMHVVLVDGRERYATRDRFPLAHEIHVGMPSELAARLPANERTFVVLVAHDYKYERPVLAVALRGGAAYVGMLGSRKRGAAIRQMLADDGLTERELARLRTPIGLDIGARTPAEIALAIAAQIVAAREGKA